MRYSVLFVLISAFVVVGCSSTFRFKADDNAQIDKLNLLVKSHKVTITLHDSTALNVSDATFTRSSVQYHNEGGSPVDVPLDKVKRIVWKDRLQGAKKGFVNLGIVGTSGAVVITLYSVTVSAAYDEKLDGFKLAKVLTGFVLAHGIYGFVLGGLFGMTYIVEIDNS